MCEKNCCSKKEKTKWDIFKHSLLHWFGSLIMERNEEGIYSMSLSRLSFWLAFLPALGIWLVGRGDILAGNPVKDISPNHFNILLVLISLNFGKKTLDVIKKVMSKKVPEEVLGQGDGP